MDFLKKVLSKETYEKVVEELKGKGKDGADMTLLPNDGTYVPVTKFNEANDAKKTLETERDNYKSELEKLKNSSDDVSGLKKQIEDLEATITTNKTNYENELNTTRLNSAVKLALSGKVHDTDIVSGLIDKTKLTLDENLNVKMGLDEQLKELQTNKPFLFLSSDDGKDGGVEGTNPPPAGKLPDVKDFSLRDAIAEKINVK